MGLSRIPRLLWRSARTSTALQFRNWLGPYSSLRDVVLVVAKDPSSEKTKRVIERLHFYSKGLPRTPPLHIVNGAGFAALMLSRNVIQVDQSEVPRFYRQLDRSLPPGRRRIFDLDFEHNRYDGWDLCGLAQSLAGLPRADRELEARQRLDTAVRATLARKKDRVYVFGTGPSLEAARERNFSDGHVIVCNTIVRDAALWHHLNPDFIVAGDAIYHFGHTSHARAFRADLKKRLAESQGRTWFVYPDLFDAIVDREFGEVKNTLIPIPFGKHSDIGVSLSQRFELPVGLGNVLNVLLLPLACTLSRSVWLWGFDGRAPSDKLFWSNSNRHAYLEHVDELKGEHPAFFEQLVPKGQESSYVKKVHGEALEERLARAEAEGFEFVMMHFTWTETLDKRRRDRDPSEPETDQTRASLS